MPFGRLRPRRVALALVVTALAGVTEAAPPERPVQESPKSVLMLDSEEVARAGYLTVSLAFRQALADAYSGHVSHFVESLDFSRFQHSDYQNDLRDWFLHKYAKRPVDVIVPVTPEALM